MSPLSLQSVSKNFAGTPALDAVSLEFPESSITAVIGPSGCGKSTLLKLCNGLEKPDSGEVQAFGRQLDYGALPPLRRRMGYAVQGNGLFPHLTARDNITLLARLERWQAAAIEQRLEELLTLCQLQPALLDRFPHQLSGGQQQRVGLCRAMMLRPEILLLDEPFAAIDPTTRLEIQRQVLAMHRAEPTTAVLVTHDMREALRLADQLVIMAGGRVIRSAGKHALLAGLEDLDPDELLPRILEQQKGGDR